MPTRLLPLLLAVFAGGAAAQDYPNAPIKLLVGFSPGGGLDISCRHWASRASTRLGQQMVVENRPGAAGEIAVKAASQAKPDGYTLVCLSGSNTISSSKPSPPFDVRTDVSPVIQMNKFTFVLYVNPKVPAKTLQELVAYSRANPGKLNYGSVGVGSTPHLAFEHLKLKSGLDAVHVPYKGTAQTSQAAIAGDIQIGLDAIAAIKPHFDAGTLRPIAVVSAERAPMLPNVPGMKEAGVADVDITSWSGVAAPPNTPPAVIDRLNREFNAVLQEPETKTIFFNQGYEVAGGSAQDFRRMLAAEVDQWRGVVSAAKISFE
jgi:tripartite-type tricarboxylate transporter receptor subunit TctC